MSTESIQFTLKERFEALLSEFYRRRIIFWKDEDQEFETMLDELDLPGVNIGKFTGTNNFDFADLETEITVEKLQNI